MERQERKQLVSKILELQGNAAKTSTLASQNEQYGKRTQNLEGEVKKLRSQLKQVEVQKNSFERDIAIYVTENKSLEAQLEAIKSAHSENETTSFGLLQEIKEGHKKVLKLKQTEFDASLENMRDEMIANERKWKEKFQKLECSQITLRKEKVKLEENLKEQERTLAEAEKSSSNRVESIRAEMLTGDKSWKEKVQKLEKFQVATSKDKYKLQEILKEKEKLLEEAEKSSSTGQMKNQIQIQALESKLKKSEEGKDRLKESHKLEMQKLEKQLEEREKQLGSQSNVSKRLHTNLKSDVELAKQEVKAEIEKNKDLNSHLLKQKLKIQSLTENLKSAEEERRVKIKYYEEQILVLRKELESRSCKVDDLQKQVMEVGEANGSEIHELNQKMNFLKKEKRAAQNKIVELTEELEAVKKSKSSETEKIVASHKQEIEKLRNESKEKESKTIAQSCISRKVQENMKRQLDCAKEELETEKIRNSELNVELKRLEVRLKNVQETVRNSSDEKSLKLKLGQEEITALQQELTIKNNKLHELQKQLLGLQEINGKDLEELTEKLSTAKREKRTAQTKITELLEEINLAERQKSKAEMASRLSKEKQEKLTQQLEEAAVKSKAQEQKVMQLEDDLRSQKANSNCSSDQLKKQLDEMTTTKRCLEQDIEEKKMVMGRMNRDLDEFKQTAQKAEKELEIKLNCSEEKLRYLEEESRDRIHEIQVKLDQAHRDLSSKQKASEDYSKKVEDNFSHQLQEAEKKKEVELIRMESDLAKAYQEIEDLKEAKSSIEEKFNILRENCMVIETLEEQVEEYQQKCQELQDKNSSLIDKLGATSRLKADSNREVEKRETEMIELSERRENLEKEVNALKQTCVLMEEQIEDLEKFNNQLLTNQEEIKSEKENAVKASREMKAKLDEVEHLVTIEKRRGCELEDYKQEEIIECQVKMRQTENELHELQDTLSDLERKYKMVEMQASTMQKKLTAEKEENSRLNYDIADLKTRLTLIEKSKHRTTDGLRAELERADELARQVTDHQNQLDTIKMKNSHETIKMNCTIAQQSKLIDFLQAKVEELEPHDSKKKKKKKNDLYQVPLQYRELQEMLEEEKQRTIQLQQKVNNLRTELQNTKSDFGRLKHGINGTGSSQTLSPGSMAAITALVRSPNLQTPTQANSSKSKHRMHHNIPHRLAENLCTHATKCNVCLDTLRFGRVLLRCSECHVTCHVKCRSNMTSACGLPGGLVQHFKNGGKAVAASPVSCITAGDDQTDVQGWLKVLCGGSSWQQKWVKLHEGVIIITNSEKPNHPAKRAKVDTTEREVIDLMKQQGYVHTMVSKSELDSTAGTDVPYSFKLELGPDTSCWPPRSLYFLASGFTDKQKWVKALEAITTRNSTNQNPLTDSKVLGNKILSLQMNEKLEINCCLPISKENVLFGCDEGLFILSPSTAAICDRSQLIKISGMQQVLQMNFLKEPNLIVAIEGHKRRVVTCDVSNLVTSPNRNGDSVSKISAVDDLIGCHLFAVGSVEGCPHLCAASASLIKIFRFNNQLGKFMKRKEIATTEPCTCLQFTMCSIIMGTNKFYEVEMKSYKVDEFLDSSDKSLHFAHDSFPVSVLQIAQMSDGKQEYLLCYHEFGVFVDAFGKRTRANNITWSRLPLSFAYRSPYLIVTHFYSVEILKVVDHNDNIAMQQAYMNIPSPRYLGSAITEGAVYLSGSDCGKITVYCCKGNMDNDNDKENETIRQTPKSCLKRRRLELAASSQESLDDITARKKAQRNPSIDSQSTVLSGSTNFESTRSMSGSCDSLLSCNTSRWTLESRVSRMPMDGYSSPIQRRLLRGSRESMDSIDSTVSSDATLSKLSEDDSNSTQSGYSSRLMWKPVSNSGKKSAPEKPIRKTKTPTRPQYDRTEV